MITGTIRSQIDQIWNAFWTGGISNPLEVIEQITYRRTDIGARWRSTNGQRRLSSMVDDNLLAAAMKPVGFAAVV